VAAGANGVRVMWQKVVVRTRVQKDLQLMNIEFETRKMNCLCMQTLPKAGEKQQQQKMNCRKIDSQCLT
jgi:hypothetical protein